MSPSPADVQRHVQFEVTEATGRIYSQLLIGTRDQLADSVRDALMSALTYGGATDIHLRPIHPANVARL